MRELGYRLTPQRMLILAAVQASDSHISAEEIYSQVRAQYPHVNISTVYRTLDLLKGLSLVTETDLGEGRVRYHYADKGHHHHLICERCGAIIDVDEVNNGFTHRQFNADIRHFAIFGRCTKCPR